jgi:hypothetical protein
VCVKLNANVIVKIVKNFANRNPSLSVFNTTEGMKKLINSNINPNTNQPPTKNEILFKCLFKLLTMKGKAIARNESRRYKSE